MTWAVKSKLDGHLIEVHSDRARAAKSAVKHTLENGMDVEVVEVVVSDVVRGE